MAQRTAEDLLNGYGSGLEFESFILPILRDSGYFDDFEIRRFDWDFGLDATATRPDGNDKDVRFFIDVKYSQHDRRVTLDRILPSALQYEKLTKSYDFEFCKLLIITNLGLTIKAREFCIEHDYDFWDRNNLLPFLDLRQPLPQPLELFA